ncbi:hypothetical protein COBT_000335 [Conglomerata obtusa]
MIKASSESKFDDEKEEKDFMTSHFNLQKENELQTGNHKMTEKLFKERILIEQRIKDMRELIFTVEIDDLNTGEALFWKHLSEVHYFLYSVLDNKENAAEIKLLVEKFVQYFMTFVENTKKDKCNSIFKYWEVIVLDSINSLNEAIETPVCIAIKISETVRSIFNNIKIEQLNVLDKFEQIKNYIINQREHEVTFIKNNLGSNKYSSCNELDIGQHHLNEITRLIIDICYYYTTSQNISFMELYDKNNAISSIQSQSNYHLEKNTVDVHKLHERIKLIEAILDIIKTKHKQIPNDIKNKDKGVNTCILEDKHQKLDEALHRAYDDNKIDTRIIELMKMILQAQQEVTINNITRDNVRKQDSKIPILKTSNLRNRNKN